MTKTTNKKAWALGDKVWIKDHDVAARITGFFIKVPAAKPLLSTPLEPDESNILFLNSTNISRFEELLVADKTPDPACHAEGTLFRRRALYDKVEITAKGGWVGFEMPADRLKKRTG